MTKQEFKNIDEVLLFLENQFSDNSTKTVNLTKCIFNFDNLGIDVLIENIIQRKDGLECISFKGSIFKLIVRCNLPNYKSIYENRKFVKQKSTNTKIDFKLDFSEAIFEKEVDFSAFDIDKDIDFEDTVFHGDVEFKEITFNGNLRLVGTKFRRNLTFGVCKFNKDVDFVIDKKIAKFKGDVTFSRVEFNKVSFWKVAFEQDVCFQEVVFNSDVFFKDTVFNGETTFISFRTIGATEFRKNVYFENAEIKYLKLVDIIFENLVSFNNSKIAKIKTNNVHCMRNPLVMNQKTIAADRDTARFMKLQAIKNEDSILALEYKSQETENYRKELSSQLFGSLGMKLSVWIKKLIKKLKWLIKIYRLLVKLIKWVVSFFEWLGLILNTVSSNNGRSWIQGLGFTVVLGISFYTWHLYLYNSLIQTQYIKGLIEYLWLPNGLDGLYPANACQPCLSAVIVFILGKIFIGYGIFQTLYAFRKHIKL